MYFDTKNPFPKVNIILNFVHFTQKKKEKKISVKVVVVKSFTARCQSSYASTACFGESEFFHFPVICTFVVLN